MEDLKTHKTQTTTVSTSTETTVDNGCQICSANVGNKCHHCDFYICGFCYVKLKNKSTCPHCKQSIQLVNNIDSSELDLPEMDRLYDGNLLALSMSYFNQFKKLQKFVNKRQMICYQGETDANNLSDLKKILQMLECSITKLIISHSTVLFRRFDWCKILDIVGNYKVYEKVVYHLLCEFSEELAAFAKTMPEGFELLDVRHVNIMGHINKTLLEELLKCHPDYKDYQEELAQDNISVTDSDQSSSDTNSSCTDEEDENRQKDEKDEEAQDDDKEESTDKDPTKEEEDADAKDESNGPPNEPSNEPCTGVCQCEHNLFFK